jgi:hypothetical protein
MPARKVPRSVHESARDVARDIARTEAYVTSRRERKKIEMLFAHLKRILRLDRLCKIPSRQQQLASDRILDERRGSSPNSARPCLSQLRSSIGARSNEHPGFAWRSGEFRSVQIASRDRRKPQI